MDGIVLTLKKFFKPIVWKGLDVYEQHFSSKSHKARKFDRAIKKNRIYFTANVNTNGFTDQIARLIFFYKVGSSLGLYYHHTPLQSDRSLPVDNAQTKENNRDIYSFIGLNQYFESLSFEIPKEGCEHILIDLDQMEFERRSGTSYENFIFFLKHKMWDHINEEKNIVIHFRGSENVFYYYRLIAPVKSSLTIRKAYFQHRQKNPCKSVFSQGKAKLLLHIRQGDTAIIETPWKHYIGTSYKIQNRFTEADSEGAVGDHHVIGVKIYYNFLKELFDELGSRQFSAVMFSDGFKRAFRDIIEYMETTSPDSPKIDALNKQKETYDQVQFKEFLEWDNVDTYVGEENEKLYRLFHSYMESDIIIFGSQAKFIPKMAAIYSYPEHMPLLIYLYRVKHPHVDYLGIDHNSNRILFVDIDHYDIKQIANQIKKYGFKEL